MCWRHAVKRGFLLSLIRCGVCLSTLYLTKTLRPTRIKLLRKLALCMNGVDVSSLKVGDIMELSEDRAQMMIDEGWAERVEPMPVRESLTRTPLRAN